MQMFLNLVLGISPWVAWMVDARQVCPKQAKKKCNFQQNCKKKNKGSIYVPNPCSQECFYGQWDSWSTWGKCNMKCGGGEMYRTRICNSVCDNQTPVDNCFGDNYGFMPCNTDPCYYGMDM